MGEELVVVGGMPAEVKPGTGGMPETPGGTGTPEAGPGAEDGQAELGRLRAALKKANAEAAERRKRLETLEQAEAQRKQSELSDLERTQQRLAELERTEAARQQERQEMLARYEFKLAALQPGSGLAPDTVDAAWKLLDPAEMEFDDDGKPTNVAAVLKEVLKRYPFLAVRVAAPNINAGDQGRQDQNRPDSEREKELRARFRLRG